jgi:hypothetical protein
MKVNLWPRNFESEGNSFLCEDESVLVSCMTVWKMFCTSVLTAVVVRVPCLVLLGLKSDDRK